MDELTRTLNKASARVVESEIQKEEPSTSSPSGEPEQRPSDTVAPYEELETQGCSRCELEVEVSRLVDAARSASSLEARLEGLRGLGALYIDHRARVFGVGSALWERGEALLCVVRGERLVELNPALSRALRRRSIAPRDLSLLAGSEPGSGRLIELNTGQVIELCFEEMSEAESERLLRIRALLSPERSLSSSIAQEMERSEQAHQLFQLVMLLAERYPKPVFIFDERGLVLRRNHQAAVSFGEVASWDELLSTAPSLESSSCGDINTLSLRRGGTLNLVNIGPWRLGFIDEEIGRISAQSFDFESIIDGAYFYVVVVRRDGRICYANRLTEDRFGAESVIGLPLEELFAVDAWAKFCTSVGQLWSLGVIAQQEVELRDAHGRQRSTLISARVLMGEAETAVFIGVDIDKLKATEAQLRQTQKLESIGQLAGGVAHDFNNLLSVILGYSDIMLEELSSCDEMRESLNEIVRAGQQARNLTRQLLVLSRQQEMSMIQIELVEHVRQTTGMLHRLIQANVSLELDLPKEAIWINGDSTHLSQILINLVVNARDAIDGNGRIALRVKALSAEGLGVVSDGVSAWAVIEVEDDGRGMSEELKARIFEPFFTTKGSCGTGMGLALVASVVERHQGTIRVESVEGHGTRFEICLPMLEAVERSQSDQSLFAVPSGRGERVLVVEDDEIVRELSLKVLHRLGYRVSCASDGVAALELIRSEGAGFDLVLSDVVMPGLSGPELRAQAPNLPFVFMSGYSDDVVLVRNLRGQPEGFLQKPFSVDGLALAVRRALDAQGSTRRR